MIADNMGVVQQCGTKGCENPSPLAVPIVAKPHYYSDDEAKRDARCRPCCEVIDMLIAPVLSLADELMEGEAKDSLIRATRAEVLAMPIDELRPTREIV